MDTLFFIASKLIGALIRPDTWIIITLGLVMFALLFHRRKLALTISAIIFMALVMLAILPVGDILLQPIEQSFPANPPLTRVNGIIVLGGGEDARASAYWGQMQLNEGGERYTEALALAHRFPEARVLFTGGSGALRDLTGSMTSEASMAGQFFNMHGVQPERILLEGQSRNTAENAVLSLALAQPAVGEVWVLITSAFHMPRAMLSFEVAGWEDLVAWPVDYRTSGFGDGVGWDLTGNLFVLNTAIREHIGQLAYRLTRR